MAAKPMRAITSSAYKHFNSLISKAERVISKQKVNLTRAKLLAEISFPASVSESVLFALSPLYTYVV